MPFYIIKGNITTVDADIIVNAANSQLMCGGGVCGAIFNSAGKEELQAECNKIGFCNTGSSVITSGCRLQAKHIIHTCGPIWRGGGQNEAELLKSCYVSSLKLAEAHKAESIAFPLISAGIYGYPRIEAFRIACDVLSDFVLSSDMTVYLVIFDGSVAILPKELCDSIPKPLSCGEAECAVLANTFDEPSRTYQSYSRPILRECKAMPAPTRSPSLDSMLKNPKETFSQMLMRLIDEHGISDVDVYKRANIDRRLFSKIRSDINYKPSKRTAIAFALSLKLPLTEASALLESAGYTLSRSLQFDIIVLYFIESDNYDVFSINEVLFAFDEQLIGA